MHDPVISCFKDEFDRFFGLLEKQIDVCPDDLWTQKTGGYIFWQQLLHVIACVELYALPEGESSKQTAYERGVIMLSALPKRHMTKTEMRELAAAMKTLAHTFIDGQSTATLTSKHARISKALGKELTNQHALMGLVRHACYHLGCCDAALRQHGVPGVY